MIKRLKIERTQALENLPPAFAEAASRRQVAPLSQRGVIPFLKICHQSQEKVVVGVFIPFLSIVEICSIKGPLLDEWKKDSRNPLIDRMTPGDPFTDQG